MVDITADSRCDEQRRAEFNSLRAELSEIRDRPAKAVAIAAALTAAVLTAYFSVQLSPAAQALSLMPIVFILIAMTDVAHSQIEQHRISGYIQGVLESPGTDQCAWESVINLDRRRLRRAPGRAGILTVQLLILAMLCIVVSWVDLPGVRAAANSHNQVASNELSLHSIEALTRVRMSTLDNERWCFFMFTIIVWLICRRRIAAVAVVSDDDRLHWRALFASVRAQRARDASLGPSSIQPVSPSQSAEPQASPSASTVGDLRTLLTHITSVYGPYHNHKENAAWAAIAASLVLLPGIGAAIASLTPMNSHVQVVGTVVVVTASIVILWLVMKQFQLRGSAADITNACLHLSASMHHLPSQAPQTLLTPEFDWLPRDQVSPVHLPAGLLEYAALIRKRTRGARVSLERAAYMLLMLGGILGVVRIWWVQLGALLAR